MFMYVVANWHPRVRAGGGARHLRHSLPPRPPYCPARCVLAPPQPCRVLGDRMIEYTRRLIRFILATVSELSSLPHCAPSLSPIRRPGSSPSSLL